MRRAPPLWPFALLALAGVVVAQGYQPNFIRALLSPIITGGATVSGGMTVSGVTTVQQLDAGNITLASPGKLCLNVACTVYLRNDGFDAWTIVGAVNITGAVGASGTVTSDVYGNFKVGLQNTATSADCSGNTGAVCVNDANGQAWANGSGTTVATMSNAGKATIATLAITATTDLGTCTIDGAGTCTGTVRANSKCIACWDITAGTSMTCVLSGTTLSLSGGTPTNTAAWFCPTSS